MKPLLALAILAALSLVAHGSVAADRTPLGWTLEVDPADGSEQSCDRERLVREVELACDALGKSCVVAGENEPRHAVLHCAKAWLLEARDAEGTLLWTMPINGDGDRIRQAAMWIARDSSEARLAAALPEHPSPEATTPVEATEKPPPPPAAPAPPPVVEIVSPPSVSPGGVLAAARGGFAGTGFGPSFGGRIAAALAIASPNLALDVAVAATGAPQGSVNDAYVSGHLGAGIVWGAPWGTAPVGASLEGGAIVFVDQSEQGPWLKERTAVRPYAEAAVTFQWRGEHTIRPFATISASVQQPQQVETAATVTIPWLTAALDLGVVWRSW